MHNHEAADITENQVKCACGGGYWEAQLLRSDTLHIIGILVPLVVGHFMHVNRGCTFKSEGHMPPLSLSSYLIYKQTSV